MRYIAINDGVDSAKGDNDFTPFRNLFNDFYAKDTSKKVRAIKKAQGMAGEHLTKPPYGYKVDPNDRKKWIVDEEAAAVVKRIFDLCVAGNGPMRIAKILKADKVLTTRAHYAKQKELTEKVKEEQQKVDIIFNFVGEIHLPTDLQTEQKEATKQKKTA